MQFRNATVFLDDQGFVRAGFAVEDGVFTAVIPGDGPADGIDLQGQVVIPGLIDIHTHGNSGEDFSDGSYDGLVRMGRYLAQNGVTGFAPASMTLPYEVLETASAARGVCATSSRTAVPPCSASTWKAPSSRRRRKERRTVRICAILTGRRS